MNKNLLIIPGFGESASDAPYARLKASCGKQYHVVTFTPQWNYRVASDWLAGLEKQLEKIDTIKTTVICFSLGAYITLLAAERVSFQKVILCSLSPFFKEQLRSMPEEARRYLGKRRITDFSKHNLPKKLMTRQVVFLFGAKDWSYGITQSKLLATRYHAKHVLIPNIGHELDNEYLTEIKKHLV